MREYLVDERQRWLQTECLDLDCLIALTFEMVDLYYLIRHGRVGWILCTISWCATALDAEAALLHFVRIILLVLLKKIFLLATAIDICN